MATQQQRAAGLDQLRQHLCALTPSAWLRVLRTQRCCGPDHGRAAELWQRCSGALCGPGASRPGAGGLPQLQVPPHCPNLLTPCSDPIAAASTQAPPQLGHVAALRCLLAPGRRQYSENTRRRPGRLRPCEPLRPVCCTLASLTVTMQASHRVQPQGQGPAGADRAQRGRQHHLHLQRLWQERALHSGPVVPDWAGHPVCPGAPSLPAQLLGPPQPHPSASAAAQAMCRQGKLLFLRVWVQRTVCSMAAGGPASPARAAGSAPAEGCRGAAQRGRQGCQECQGQAHRAGQRQSLRRGAADLQEVRPTSLCCCSMRSSSPARLCMLICRPPALGQPAVHCQTSDWPALGIQVRCTAWPRG